jgi:hypothetical protein
VYWTDHYAQKVRAVRKDLSGGAIDIAVTQTAMIPTGVASDDQYVYYVNEHELYCKPKPP